jgi:hypothetical protein
MPRPSPAYRPMLACAALCLTAAPMASLAQSLQDADRAPTNPTPLFDASPIADADLSKIAGRENTPLWQTATASSNATVKDNSVGNNSPTGELRVSDSAFQNVSGISMVNLNTGNASVINAALNVNLSITMAPVPTTTPGGM